MATNPIPVASASGPLVSVIVTNYNYGDFVTRALASVEAQTYRPIEVVIVDDASTDSSVEQIEAWIEASAISAKLVKKALNEGVGAALADGLAETTGDFVAILDADDEFYPDKLSLQVPRLIESPAIALYSFVDIVDESGAKVHGATSVPTEQPSGDVREALIRLGTFAATNSALMRGPTLRRVGFRRDRRLSQDFAMWLGLAAEGPVSFEPVTVGRVWEHAGSIRASNQQTLRHQYRVELLAEQWSEKSLRPALLQRLTRVSWALGKARSREGARAVMRASWQCRSVRLPAAFVLGVVRSALKE